MGSDAEKGVSLDLNTSNKTDSRTRSKPQRECFCRSMNCFTALCALLCLVAHCMAIAVGPKIHDGAGLLQQALRLYGIAFSILIMLTAQGETDFHKSLKLYRLVAGISLLVCGSLYILGGILCWNRHKAKVRYQREAERARVLEDLEALDHKRQELKGLLAVYSSH